MAIEGARHWMQENASFKLLRFFLSSFYCLKFWINNNLFLWLNTHYLQLDSLYADIWNELIIIWGNNCLLHISAISRQSFGNNGTCKLSIKEEEFDIKTPVPGKPSKKYFFAWISRKPFILEVLMGYRIYCKAVLFAFLRPQDAREFMFE